MARYTAHYTRQVFESLWEGREHLCPYWDDREWPELFDPCREMIDPVASQKLLCCCDISGGVRWLEINHNDRDCYFSEYCWSESSEYSDSDPDSNGSYTDDDDEGQEEKEEEEEVEEEGEEAMSVQDTQTVPYKTNTSEDTVMDDFFAELEAQFGSILPDAHISEA
ncbi:hypothetical protein F4678DRAFT_334855 [Xylaria arbuscula]|nr:hypothetical protein F4678DRAFT_334855 [Xylaria arbuscula]